MAASLATGDQDLSGTPEDPTNLRCRKCRRCLIDSTSLLKMVTSSEAAATCNVWHLNVESLPDWILAAVYQVHWTVGKLNCQYCGARLGGFNFINGPKCTCGHDTTVHLSKSRVDQDLKPPVLLTRPGMTRGLSERRSNKTESPGHQREIKVVNCPIQTVSSVETLQRRQTQSTQLDVLPSLSSTTNTSCTFSRTVSAGDVNEPEADVESSEEPQNIGTAEMDTEVPLVSESLNPPQPSGHPENPEEGHVISVSQSRDSPPTAMDQDGVRLQVMEQPIRNPPNPETKLSKREKNHLKSLRRKQRKKERWIQSQQRAKDLAMKWDLTNSDDEDKEGYTCAVCLDVYYKPYKCHPCSHVFCEPCLRTLAKNRPSNTLCPLCRTLISHVLFQEELNQTTKKCFPKVYWSRHETFKKTNYSKWPLPNCPKRFHNFWGFQRHGRPASRWQFPHRAFGLDVLDLGDMWGWPFDIDFVIISINSLHWLLAFIIFCGLCYFFLL